MHGGGRKLARNLRFGGIRRHACTQWGRLITRRSQVQSCTSATEKGSGSRAFSLTVCCVVVLRSLGARSGPAYTRPVATCPACGKELPAGDFSFCPFCAAPLTGTPPTALERKVVSVLFCDLVGFTAASEQADPEDVRARLRPYHARLRSEIEAYGGTVEKFVGDAVMAVFGAPVAHEDDAERAVRAALRILEAIAELNAGDPLLSLQVRIGINSGEAVVALGAKPEAGEGIVTGDVVNTASRLQGVAPVDGIACSEQTYRSTERVFEYEALEPAMVKGKSEPLTLFRPLRAKIGRAHV